MAELEPMSFSTWIFCADKGKFEFPTGTNFQLFTIQCNLSVCVYCYKYTYKNFLFCNWKIFSRKNLNPKRRSIAQSCDVCSSNISQLIFPQSWEIGCKAHTFTRWRYYSKSFSFIFTIVYFFRIAFKKPKVRLRC